MAGYGLQSIPDKFAAPVKVWNNRTIGLQTSFVVIRMPDCQRGCFSLETMPLRNIARNLPKCLNRNDSLAVQCQQAMYGTHEMNIPPAIGKLIRHYFWNG